VKLLFDANLSPKLGANSEESLLVLETGQPEGV